MSKFTNYQEWRDCCTDKGALRFQPAGENMYATAADNELVGTWSFVTRKGEVFEDMHNACQEELEKGNGH